MPADGSIGLLLRTALCLTLVVLVMPAALAASAAEVPGRFLDDDGLPAERHLEILADLGAIEGCDPPAFSRSCPERGLNRAEAAKILVVAGQAMGTLPPIPVSLEDRFTDDDEIWDGTASRLADFLAERGVIDGCNPPANTRYCPTDRLTRGQVAKMVVNAFGLAAPGSFPSPWTDTKGRFYDEAARIGAYHELWDTSAGRFSGGGEVSRAEFAMVVVRAIGTDPCPDDPFTAARVEGLERRHPAQSFAAYVYDTRSGCAYWMGPDNRLRTASVFKVMVMAGTLLEAQRDDRPVSDWEMSRLLPMVTESANQPVRDLWSHFGASPWFRDQARVFGLDETITVGDTESGWGRTTTSAKDQGNLIRQVLLGNWGPLEQDYREVAWDLMTSVVSSQTWGITSGVPSDWLVAQKNGFAGGVANSVGYVREPDSEDGYVVVVLSNGWGSWEQGIPVVEEIAGWISGALIP